MIMPCFHLIKAYRAVDGSVVFSEIAAKQHGGLHHELKLPCGQCWGCRLERSRQWAMRCMHEAQMHDQNCFITLTYNDENLRQDRSLNYRDFQLFMKRLRKKLGVKNIRFTCAGSMVTSSIGRIFMRASSELTFPIKRQ